MHTDSRDGQGPDRPDIVLVTIDSWRRDTLERMPRLRAALADYDETVAVAQSAATHGSFASILASRYAPQAYQLDGLVRPDVTTLPGFLAENGYATGAVVASNPYVAKWDLCFDHFWNDGMDISLADASGEWYSKFDQASRFVRLKGRVTAPEAFDRAREWYDAQTGPRFLWIHLMDIHGPFFPGVRKAREEGLARTYASLARYHIRGEKDDPAVNGTIRNLYDRCVERLDDQLPDLLRFVDDDALVVLTGDHGEEFDHGYYGHAQLYDETVVVPLFAKNLAAPVADAPVRHLDIAPTVAATLGLTPSEGWEGSPIDGVERPAMLLNHAPKLGRTFVGVRADGYKLIHAYNDTDWTLAAAEYYDLRADPEEMTPLDGTDLPVDVDLNARLEGFLARSDLDLEVVRQTNSGIDDHVRDRLEELGYV